MQPDTSSLGFGVAETDTFQHNEVVAQKVLIEENSGQNHKFPHSLNLDRNLSPDWILILSLSVMAIFAWINVIYSKFINVILQSAFNYQVSLRLYGDANQVQKRISRLFDLIYFVTAGLYLYLLFRYFKIDWFDLPDLKIFMVCTSALMALFLLRLFLFKFTGWVFDQLKIFNEALFQFSLFNKIIGIVIVPFIILISYTKDIYLDVAVYTSIILFICINILRFMRGILFTVKKVFSIFYFILYLCTLEILPVLVIVKVIFLLAKVS